MNQHILDHTIVAISTPIGEGGIGIVRLSGPEALKIADMIFVSKDGRRPSEFETYTIHYGHIINTTYDIRHTKYETIDEVLLTVMRAPKSYTKEDVVEINCHAGIQATKKVLGLVVKCGARIAEPGEFTKRAFLNGRLDLSQAEAVLDIIRAKTEGSLKVAMSQLEGELSKRVNEIREKVVEVASHIEASIDFPEEELEIIRDESLIKKTEDVMTQLKELISTYDEGIVYREGVLAIICGKPNVGKSSLMNLLLKRDRVIVSPIPGTTRDAVEEMINLRGIPIRLVDTAGIVETKDILEKEGVKKSTKYLVLADIVLLVLDASTKIDKKDLDIIKLVRGKKKIVVVNKIDLKKQKIEKKKIDDLFKEDKVIEVSVEKKKNIQTLENAIVEMIFSGAFRQAEPAMVSNARHKELLDKALENMLSVNKALAKGGEPELVAIDLKEAIFNLGLIIGKEVSDDILDRIFDQFCIGK